MKDKKIPMWHFFVWKWPDCVVCQHFSLFQISKLVWRENVNHDYYCNLSEFDEANKGVMVITTYLHSRRVWNDTRPQCVTMWREYQTWNCVLSCPTLSQYKQIHFTSKQIYLFSVSQSDTWIRYSIKHSSQSSMLYSLSF